MHDDLLTNDVQLQRELSHNSKVRACTAHSPEKVCILLCVGHVDIACAAQVRNKTCLCSEYHQR